MPTRTCWIGLSCLVGLTHSVQPSDLAISYLPSLRSMPMMRLAPAILAAWTTARPTAPRPKTATELPVSTFALFQTAPQPVETPHPKRQIFSSGASIMTFAQEISASTVYSDMVEQPMKW